MEIKNFVEIKKKKKVFFAREIFSVLGNRRIMYNSCMQFIVVILRKKDEVGDKNMGYNFIFLFGRLVKKIKVYNF